MYNYSDVEKKERRKIIGISGAIVAVILVLVVAIIVVATNRNSTPTNVGGEDNSSFTLDDTEKKDEKPAEEPAKTETKSTISTEVASTSTAEKLPETGAADLLPLALVLGVLTASATAYAMSKR